MRLLENLKKLPITERITKDTKKEDLIGNLVIAPPSTMGQLGLKKWFHMLLLLQVVG